MKSNYFRSFLKLIFLAVLLPCTRTQAQTQSPVSQFATGNGDGFGVFNTYPQISYTGTPNIGIPLHQLSYEGLNLPIVLNYNNNLVKPYNRPSWMGMGWSLPVGGAINRTVTGYPMTLTGISVKIMIVLMIRKWDIFITTAT